MLHKLQGDCINVPQLHATGRTSYPIPTAYFFYSECGQVYLASSLGSICLLCRMFSVSSTHLYVSCIVPCSAAYCIIFIPIFSKSFLLRNAFASALVCSGVVSPSSSLVSSGEEATIAGRFPASFLRSGAVAGVGAGGMPLSSKSLCILISLNRCFKCCRPSCITCESSS